MPTLVSRLPVGFILLWAAVSIFIYYFYLSETPNRSHTIPLQKDDFFDGVVFITMGSLAQNKMIDVTLSSIRKIGRWKGAIYVLTDRPECFTKAMKTLDVKIITIPSMTSFMAIKAVKPSMFRYLPNEVKSVLYLDSDIITTRNLNTFIRHVSILVQQQSIILNTNKATTTDKNLSIIKGYQLGMFHDSKGHFVGFCSGCDKWHTGVMWLQREAGKDCLQAWERLITSGKYYADQEAMDQAEKDQFCSNILAFPSRHLLFARDYLALAFTSSRSFLHLTSAVRLQSQDYLYREVVVPALMSPVIRELDHRYLEEPSSCSTSTLHMENISNAVS